MKHAKSACRRDGGMLYIPTHPANQSHKPGTEHSNSIGQRIREQGLRQYLVYDQPFSTEVGHSSGKT